MSVEANVHKLTAQHAKEVDEEYQLEEQTNLITMDESLKIPISMPAASLPPFPLVPTTSPLLFPLGPHSVSMAGSSTLMSEPEIGLPLENLHGIGSKLNKHNL